MSRRMCVRHPLSILGMMVMLGPAGYMFGGASPSYAPRVPATVDSLTRDTSVQIATVTPEHGPLEAQLARISQQARRRHLTPILDVGAPWCGPCRAVDATLASPDMQPTMRHIYLVHANVDQWTAALHHLWVDVRTIPQIMVLDSTGTPVRPAWQFSIPDSLSAGSPAWTTALRQSLQQYFAQATVGC